MMQIDAHRFGSVGSGLTADELITHFQSVQRSQFTGRLDVTAGEGKIWVLYFRLGRLIWTSCERHRFRRWRRCMRFFCPEVAIETLRLREVEIGTPEYIEYIMLMVLVQRGHIPREKAIAITQQIIQEVLFELCCHLEKVRSITVGSEKSEIKGDALVLLNGEQYFHQVVKLWQSWGKIGMALYSPNLALHTKDVDMLKAKASPTTYERLLGYTQESSTLWDMSLNLSKDISTVAQLLMPYLGNGMLGLRDIPDLPPPTFSGAPQGQKAAGADCPLVVCIDDSKVLCEQVAKILGANYRFTAVSDSIQALPTLLSSKPDIIFLDLIMPVANGYEVCTQIRRVSSLKDIPVIILTGKDGIIDRVRAKMVGANDFLSKPVDSEAILEVLSRYLPKSITNSSINSSLNSNVNSMQRTYEMGDTTAFAIRQELSNSE